ncbi:transposase [Streptomyces malaysiensis]|uniref:transposase n=1 Tax=Streptomyces malaysiensis TaxID=92644 RepID=UPI00227970C5|nr:transposase [Streptomyces sp. SPMA113]
MTAPPGPPPPGHGRRDRRTRRRDRATGQAGGPSFAGAVRHRTRDCRPATGLGRRQPRAHALGRCLLPASSGRTNRHRLNRGGDRAANNALHTIVLVRMRYDERTRAYVERRTKEGLNKKDIMRCLKRFVAREIYRALTSTPADHITQTDLAPAA